MKTTCAFNDCPRLSRKNGYCLPHGKQLKAGEELTEIDTGRFRPERDELGRKWCSSCGWQEVSSFGSNASMRDGLANLCRPCMLNSSLKSKYKITHDEYLAMLESQHGVCAICGNPPPSDKLLAVDHDHSCCPGSRSCGKCVRKLLCLDCNTSLGGFKDDTLLLQRAIDYLKEFND